MAALKWQAPVPVCLSLVIEKSGISKGKVPVRFSKMAPGFLSLSDFCGQRLPPNWRLIGHDLLFRISHTSQTTASLGTAETKNFLPQDLSPVSQFTRAPVYPELQHCSMALQETSGLPLPASPTCSIPVSPAARTSWDSSLSRRRACTSGPDWQKQVRFSRPLPFSAS